MQQSSPIADRGQLPLTPAKTGPSSIDAPPSTSNSKPSLSTEAKAPTDALWVERRLRTYNCFQAEPGVLQKYPKFEKMVQKILNRKRESSINPDSAKKFHEVNRYYEKANENTFLHNILPIIIKPGRTVKSRVRADALELDQEAQYQIQVQKDEEDEKGQKAGAERHVGKEDTPSGTEHTLEQVAEQEGEKSVQEHEEYTLESFWDDGLAIKIDCEIRKGFLPIKEKDEELSRAMAKVDGMTNPKPDFTYGLRIDNHSIPDDMAVSASIDYMLEVVPFLHHPFFIIEGKSDSGSKAEAENQACRGGAALINAARQLREKIGAQATEAAGPDEQTYIYSATLSPGLMDFWVHWLEVRKMHRPLFHMHHLESVALRSDGAPGKLRMITHNILDWGCMDRLPQIQELYNQIFEYERTTSAENRRQQAEKTPTKKRRVSNKPALS